MRSNFTAIQANFVKHYVNIINNNAMINIEASALKHKHNY